MIGAVASVTIGAVFVVAGAGKVAQGRGWPRQAAALGAPRWVAPLVPWWELTIGALSIVQIAQRLTAAAALVTLMTFTALLVLRMRQGRRPVCACFGAWSATPIGWHHIARNAAFAAVAAVALLSP